MRRGECKKIEVDGAHGYTLNVINRSGIKVIRPRVKEGGCTFSVKNCDYAKLIKVLTAYKRKYRVLSSSGIVNAVKPVIKNYGLVVGVVISFLCIILYSNMITNVTIEGNVLIDENTIIEVVKSDLNTPYLHYKKDLKMVDEKVQAIDGIAYCISKKEGHRVVIKVVEELPEVVKIDTQNPKDIVSPFDGIVTKIVVYGGTSAVEVGQEVTKGQPLIYARLISTEGVERKTVALGKIELKTTHQEELIYEDENSFNSSAATDIATCIEVFKQSLNSNEVYLGSRFLVKNVDKKIVVSIYYEVITRVT
ncbi:MAG: sporulation protein YqfD [Clostridia bacterium]|nr:sporulation protein YqfD [Clostridia bacterium]